MLDRLFWAAAPLLHGRQQRIIVTAWEAGEIVFCEAANDEG